ncbi:MAG: site-2 protease family protein [Ruminococcaceae bacterium]|nr:site-2 protease family protein [Oscillospiraceae bacterium]
MERIQGPIFDIFAAMTGSASWQAAIISCFAVAVIIFVVFPIHECSHGLMAKILGDDTAEREGRLTLNPFAHIDLMGAVCMCFCCIGWAKPTPVSIHRCRKVKSRTALALTSLAGPVSNILLSYVFMIAMKIVPMVSQEATAGYVILGLYYAIVLNVYLAIFNLLPIPPFDGSKILYSFLPSKGIAFMERYSQVIYLAFFALLIFGLLDIPLNFLTDCVIWLLDKASAFMPYPLF